MLSWRYQRVRQRFEFSCAFTGPPAGPVTSEDLTILMIQSIMTIYNSPAEKMLALLASDRPGKYRQRRPGGRQLFVKADCNGALPMPISRWPDPAALVLCWLTIYTCSKGVWKTTSSPWECARTTSHRCKWHQVKDRVASARGCFATLRVRHQPFISLGLSTHLPVYLYCAQQGDIWAFQKHVKGQGMQLLGFTAAEDLFLNL